MKKEKINKGLRGELSSRDTHVTNFDTLGNSYKNWRKNSTWDDRVIQSATGAGAVGMAGAGLGDALSKDGQFVLRQSKAHYRSQIKQVKKAMGNPRARYNGKKLDSKKGEKILSKLTKKYAKAPVRTHKIGGGKLGLILGGVAGAVLPPEKRNQFSTIIDGKKFYEFARTRETDPLKGLVRDPNISIANTYGQYKKSRAMANKIVRKSKSAHNVIEDLPALAEKLRGKSRPGVLTTPQGEYRIARANRNSVRVYHKGGPRKRRRKHFWEKKSFRDKAAVTGIAGATVAGIAGANKYQKLKTRSIVRGTSVAQEVVQSVPRDIKAARIGGTWVTSGLRRKVRKKHGAYDALRRRGGMRQVTNPYDHEKKSYKKSFRDSVTKDVKSKFPANMDERSQKMAQQQINRRLSGMKSWAESGKETVRRAVPTGAKANLERTNKSLIDKISKRTKDDYPFLKPAKGLKSKIMIHQQKINDSILSRIAKTAKKVIRK